MEKLFYIEYWKTSTDLKDGIESGKANLIKRISLLIDEGYSFKIKNI